MSGGGLQPQVFETESDCRHSGSEMSAKFVLESVENYGLVLGMRN